MTIIRVGTTQKYSDGWTSAFGGKKATTNGAASKKTATKTAAAKKTTKGLAKKAKAAPKKKAKR